MLPNCSNLSRTYSQIDPIRLLIHCLEVKLPVGTFKDKVLPAPKHKLETNCVFTPDYFVALHHITAATGYRLDGTQYPANTPNHLGARVTLPHTRLQLERWRYHLIGNENAELTQFLEFGLGLPTCGLTGLTSSSLQRYRKVG